MRKVDIGSALDMTPDEKKISFLNKYFIYKKIRNVNTEEVERIHTAVSKDAEIKLKNVNAELGDVVNTVKERKPRIKKIGKMKLSQIAKPKDKSKGKMKIKIGKVRIGQQNQG